MPYMIANRMGFIQKGTSYARRIVAQASTTNKPTRSLSVVKPMPMNNVVVGSLSYWKERVDVDACELTWEQCSRSNLQLASRDCHEDSFLEHMVPGGYARADDPDEEELEVALNHCMGGGSSNSNN